MCTTTPNCKHAEPRRRASLRPLVVALAVLFGGLASSSQAHAQLQKGSLRFSLDTDMLAFGGVALDRDNGGNANISVVGFGPNQLGNTRAVGYPMPSTGLGFGYALNSKWILGVRSSLGFDVVDGEGSNDKTRYLAIAVMPGVTWVPIGHVAKLFLSLSPLIQANREKNDNAKSRLLMGGFSAGIGALIFPANAVSADIGFHFEGRFGNVNDDGPNDVHVRDLRGVIRLGLSLWR